MKRTALALLATLTVPLSACGKESAFAQTLRNRSVRGNYTYAASGVTMSFPWAFDARLDFNGRGAYTLDLTVDMKGDRDHDTDSGSYRVEEDRLIMLDKEGKTTHELLIRGDSLVADTDWRGSMLLRMVGVPRPVFVKK